MVGHRWSEVTCGGQRSHLEVRAHMWLEVTRRGQRAAASESCRVALLLALSCFPAFLSSALCLGSVVSTCSPGPAPGKCNHELMGRGKLAGP